MTIKELEHRITTRYKYNPFYSKILEITGRNILQKKWIFIIGCYNSGTTLLNQILSSHPQIAGLPDEGVMLTNQLSRPEDYGWRRMWCRCIDKMSSTVKGKEINALTIKKHWSHFYDLKKTFLLEKSISNTSRLDFINSNFESVKFIHIVRNGYAVAEGIRRKAKVMPGNIYYQKGEYPIELCAQQWVTSLKAVESFKKDKTNFIEIKYEDFTANPLDTLKSIWAFLGVAKFESQLLESAFTIHEKKSRIKNMNDSSFKRLSSEELTKINEKAQPFLCKYNYDIKS